MAQQVKVVRLEISGNLAKRGQKEGTETTQLLSNLLICGLCTTHTDLHHPLKEKALVHSSLYAGLASLVLPPMFLLRYEVNIGPCFAIQQI